MIVSKVLAMVVLTLFSAPAVIIAAQQTNDTVALTVRLRAANGTAVVDETVSLQRLPDEADIAPRCRTDMLGACTWYVERGLYQVLFARSLDEVSALALAEGGLRGFGLTVGESPITYHFTFHNDGHVYFDAAPHAATPVPIIPTAEHLHGGVEEMPTPQATVMPTATKEPAVVDVSDLAADEVTEGDGAPVGQPDEPKSTAGGWRLLILAATGLMAGSGLHWWTRRRGQRQSDAGPRSRPTIDAATTQEQNDA